MGRGELAKQCHEAILNPPQGVQGVPTQLLVVMRFTLSRTHRVCSFWGGCALPTLVHMLLHMLMERCREIDDEDVLLFILGFLMQNTG